MLRYRIARDPTGRHVVLAAPTSLVSVNETYATRAEAQDTADWLNKLKGHPFQHQPSAICVR